MSLFNTLIPSITRDPARGDNTGTSAASGQKPIYELQESKEAYGVTVYLPGVAKAGLEITADAAEIRITGRRAWTQPEGWTPLYRESPDTHYELVLTHDNAIDSDKVAAELRDGVLRVSLPKAEAIKPRKISVS